MSNINPTENINDSNWKNALQLWWALIWRTILISILFVFLMSVIFGLLSTLANRIQSESIIAVLTQISGYITIFGIFFVQVYVYKRLLDKGYGNKKIILVENQKDQVV